MTWFKAPLTLLLVGTGLSDGWQCRLLTEADLAPYNAEELRLMRNEVFARRGYVFKSKELSRHFFKQPWYRTNPTFTPDKLTSQEQANVVLLKRMEEKARKDGLARSDLADSVCEQIATLDDGGILHQSAHDFEVVLDCSRKPVRNGGADECETMLYVYDPTSRRRVGPVIRDLPRLSKPHDPNVGGPNLRLALLQLGGAFGPLVEFQHSRTISDEWARITTYYALAESGALKKVLEVETSYSHEGSPSRRTNIELVPPDAANRPPTIKAEVEIHKLLKEPGLDGKEKLSIMTTKLLPCLYVWTTELGRYKPRPEGHCPRVPAERQGPPRE